MRTSQLASWPGVVPFTSDHDHNCSHTLSFLANFHRTDFKLGFKEHLSKVRPLTSKIYLPTLTKEYIVARMMKNYTSCGDAKTFSVTSPKPDPCKLANGGPCASCLELENFDREAEVILERLSEDRRKILEKINRDHDPFIQRFPFELASQVFALCLPPQGPH